MKSQSNTTLFLELGDRVLRSWWTVVAGLCIGLAVGYLALQYLPKVYQASTRIWISQQQIPEEVVRTTVTDDTSQRLMAFRDAVLEQDYMIELIEETFGLPATEAELRGLIGTVKANIEVMPAGGGRRGGLQAFALSYRDNEPQRAARVVNTLTRLFINQNSEFRREQAEKTAETIQAMADKAKAEFDRIDAKLTRFIQKHQFETETHLAANLQLLDSRKQDLESLEKKRSLAQEELESLQEQLARSYTELPGAAPDDPNAPKVVIDPLTQRIARLQRELEELRVHYSERHPDVAKKKRELEEALALARQRDPASGGDEPLIPRDPVAAALKEQIEETKRQLRSLDDEEKAIRRDVAEFERRIAVEPEVQRQLNALNEEHAVAREDYRRLQRDAERAKGSIDLEQSGMAEQMEVLEFAPVPAFPIEPDPKRIYAVCVAFACVLLVGPMLARHALDPPIMSEASLKAVADVPLLVSIPRIVTPENRAIPRRRLLKNISLSLLFGAVLVAVKVSFG